MSDDPELQSRLETSEILKSNPEVVWSENRDGRKENIKYALEAHKISNPEFWREMSGRRVMIKPNIANQEKPESCTHPDALAVTISQLADSGVSQILIGDIPMIAEVDRMSKENLTIQDSFKKLGYDNVIEKARGDHPDLIIEVVDPRQFDKTELAESKVHAHIPPVDVIVNLASPKEHGQYHFSCGVKNLMGLSAPQDRNEYFHNHGSSKDFERITVNMRNNHEVPDPRTIEDLINLNIMAIAKSADETDGINADKMTDYVEDVIKTLDARGIKILTVIDGTKFMMGHEHEGKNHELNIAAVGLNPLAVDRLVQKRLGAYAPYLDRLMGENPIEPSIKGDNPKNILSRKNERVGKLVKLNPDHTFIYKLEVKSEVPKDGFAAVTEQNGLQQESGKKQLTKEAITEKERLTWELKEYGAVIDFLGRLRDGVGGDNLVRLDEGLKEANLRAKQIDQKLARLVGDYEWSQERSLIKNLVLENEKNKQGSRIPRAVYPRLGAKPPDEELLDNIKRSARLQGSFLAAKEALRLYDRILEGARGGFGNINLLFGERDRLYREVIINYPKYSKYLRK